MYSFHECMLTYATKGLFRTIRYIMSCINNMKYNYLPVLHIVLYKIIEYYRYIYKTFNLKTSIL